MGPQLSAWGCFSRQQILHLHILHSPSCKTTHPFPSSHKGEEGFLWKLQPKYPSVYAEPSDLEAMQINSVLIWMLPEIGDGGGEGTIYTGLFLCNRSPTPPPAPMWSVVTPRPLAPWKRTQAPAAHFILTFRKKPSSWWIPWLVCFVTASAGISLFILRWEEVALFRLC